MEGACIFICQGPPWCGLDGDEAVAAQENGCAKCERILIDEDGREWISKPSPDA